MRLSEELDLMFQAVGDLSPTDQGYLLERTRELEGLLASQLLGEDVSSEIQHVRADMVSVAARHSTEVQQKLNARIELYFKKLVALILL